MNLQYFACRCLLSPILNLKAGQKRSVLVQKLQIQTLMLSHLMSTRNRVIRFECSAVRLYRRLQLLMVTCNLCTAGHMHFLQCSCSQFCWPRAAAKASVGLREFWPHMIITHMLHKPFCAVSIQSCRALQEHIFMMFMICMIRLRRCANCLH